MKRFWMFVLFAAGSLAVLTAPVFAKGEEGSDDSSETSLEDVNQAMGSIASRVSDVEKKLGLQFFGDVRTRFAWWTQSQSDAAGAAAANGGVTNISDKAVGRYRARFGVKKDGGEFQGGLRIATGGVAAAASTATGKVTFSSNANSENNTFDNGFGNPPILIDMAYLTLVPNFLEKHLKLTAGKMGNPLTTTPMTWDPDICPEGALLEITGGDTTFRATYFDLTNPSGTAQTSSNPSTGLDEWMSNMQLEEMLKIDDKTSVKLMVGYEWVGNVSALAGGTLPPVGPGGALTTSNTPAGAGNIFDFAKVIPDFNVGEAMIQVKHKLGDIPFQWTLHGIDNFDSFNVPVGETAAGGPGGAGLKAVNGYTAWTNQYGFYLEGKAGNTDKGNWMGVAAISYVEPNAQLANLVSDDANFTNSEYLYEQVGYGLESNVSLLVSAWELEHIYDYYGTPNNKQTTGGGTSKSPELQLYVDCLFNL